jgi:hypothetical protein
MAELKTKPTDQSVEAFIAAIPDQGRREDCAALVKLFKRVTGQPARMWGPSIVGFGSYHYTYASGREGDWPVLAFSPRKQNLTLYLMLKYAEHGALMKKLGKHTTAKSCLYIKRLADIDTKVLEQLIAKSLKALPGCK